VITLRREQKLVKREWVVINEGAYERKNVFCEGGLHLCLSWLLYRKMDKPKIPKETSAFDAGRVEGVLDLADWVSSRGGQSFPGQK